MIFDKEVLENCDIVSYPRKYKAKCPFNGLYIYTGDACYHDNKHPGNYYHIGNMPEKKERKLKLIKSTLKN